MYVILDLSTSVYRSAAMILFFPYLLGLFVKQVMNEL